MDRAPCEKHSFDDRLMLRCFLSEGESLFAVLARIWDRRKFNLPCLGQDLYRFCTADPANWHFWHFSPLEEPITYVESMGCKVRLPPPPPISPLLSGAYSHILISYN